MQEGQGAGPKEKKRKEQGLRKVSWMAEMTVWVLEHMEAGGGDQAIFFLRTMAMSSKTCIWQALMKSVSNCLSLQSKKLTIMSGRIVLCM